MKMLELFSGEGLLSCVFREHGHECMTLDFNPDYKPDICIDILQFTPEMLGDFIPDVIHASPECRCFSVASIGHHWTGGKCAYIPKTEDAKTGLRMVEKMFEIINGLGPKVIYIENPVGLMRKLPLLEEFGNKNYHHVITYCQYGDTRMKPTDFWTNNPYWHPKPRCHNGDSCHEAAPRGSKTGTQGLKNSFERSKFPIELCEEILKATEMYEKNNFL